MKLIKDDRFAMIQKGYDNWNSLLTALNNVGVSEDATLEEVLSALAEDPHEDVSGQLAESNSRIQELESTIASQTQEIAQLRSLPATEPVSINPGAHEPSAADADVIKSINERYAGDPVGMMNALRENNLI